MIAQRQFERVLTMVRSNGVSHEIEAIMRPNGSSGRPRQLRVDVFLAGVICTSLRSVPLTLVNVHKTLTEEISTSAGLSLGTRTLPSGGGPSKPISIRQVRYILGVIEHRLSFGPSCSGALSDDDRRDRADVYDRILQELVEASIPQDLSKPTSFALDSTAIESFARGKKKPTSLNPVKKTKRTTPPTQREFVDPADQGTSADRDAHWGYRTKTYDNKSSIFFGYDFYGMVRVGAVGDVPGSTPHLLYGLSLRPGSTDLVEPSKSLIDRLIAAGYSVDEIINDRAFSYKAQERWADELLRRGIDQVLDMYLSERGVRDFEGIRMVDGTPHCPALPDRLVKIIRPPVLSVGEVKRSSLLEDRRTHRQLAKDIERFDATIAERQLYAFVKNQNAGPRAKDQGKSQWICPAQAGKVRCTNCAVSMHLPLETPPIENPPMPYPPKCCTQQTVMIPGRAFGKLRQKEAWGTPPWKLSYSRRTHIEGFFGRIKNTNTQTVKRGWTHVIGLVKTGIMIACVVMAANLNELLAWARRTGDYSIPGCEPLTESYGFEEVDADGNILIHAPPDL
jgi:hypothetical protein